MRNHLPVDLCPRAFKRWGSWPPLDQVAACPHPCGAERLLRHCPSDVLSTSRAAFSRRSASRRDVDATLGDLGQLVVSGDLFIEDRLERVGDLVPSELLREGPSGAVRRDLVMLDALSRRDDRRIANGIVAARADHLLALANQALHRLARLSRRRALKPAEDTFETVDLRARLAFVIAKSGLELGGSRGIDHLRKSRREALLGVVEVLE